MIKRAVLYARVSSEDQGKGYSLPTQIEACRRYADEQGYSIVEEYRDDCSGTLLSRPGLDAIRELAREGCIDMVVTYEIDRLSRRVVHQLLIEEELKKRKVAVEYVQARYEDNPEGQLQKVIRSTLAEYERAKIQERMQRGKMGRAKAGNVSLGDQAPYGYRYVSEPHKGWLEINEEEAEVVRLIYRLYLDGDGDGRRMGTPAIAQRLSVMGIPTRRDTSPSLAKRQKARKLPGKWSQPSVHHVLASETYCGVWYYNRSKQNGTSEERRPRDEWIAVEVPAIVNRETWLAARERAAENTRHKRHTEKEFLLEGRLFCDRCGMSFNTLSPGRYPNLHYYRCGGREKLTSPDWGERICKWSYRREVLDGIVWAYIAELLKNPDLLLEGIKQLSAHQAEQVTALQERLVTIDEMIAALDKQRAKLLDLYLSGDALTKDLLTERQREMTQRRAEFEKERRDVEAQLNAVSTSEQEMEEVRFACRAAAEGLDNITFARKKATLELFDVKVTLLRGAVKEEDRLRIVGKIPATDLQVAQAVYNLPTGAGSTYRTAPRNARRGPSARRGCLLQ